MRLNPRAFNPLTHKLIPSRVWEVEQCANRDSEKVIWHCADVRINGIPIRRIFTAVKDKVFEVTCDGICVRGADDAIEIVERKHDVM